MQKFFKRMPSPGSESGIFFIFVYFLSQLQRLRPLGYFDRVFLFFHLMDHQLLLCSVWRFEAIEKRPLIIRLKG